MQEKWWEQPVCYICDYWWIFLAILLPLAGWFTRDYWLPAERAPQLPLGTGDIQVTLTWQSVNDLDLHVTDPAGEVIYYGNRVSASGGNLDVDANAGCNNVTNRPVENIFWPSNSASVGEYGVQVHYFLICQADSVTPFTVHLLIDGKEQVFEGVLEHKNDLWPVTTFYFPP